MGRATRAAVHVLVTSHVLALLIHAAGCKGHDTPTSGDASSSTPSSSSKASSSSAQSPLEAITEPDRSSSALALGNVAQHRVALLADEDDAMLRVLALPEGKQVASAKLAGTPGHLLIDGSGVVWIAIRNADVVQSFTLSCALSSQPTEEVEGCALTPGKQLATATEPLALALAIDKKSLFVVSSWGRELARYSLPDANKIGATVLAREPRAILAGRNGDTVIIAHATGSVVTTAWITPTSTPAPSASNSTSKPTSATNPTAMSALPTREARLDYRDHQFDERITSGFPVSDQPRFVGQGFALARPTDHAVLAPVVAVYPGDLEPSTGYGPSDDAYFPNEVAVLSIDDPFVDSPPRLRVRATVVLADKNRVSHGRIAWPKESQPCLLPRAVAADRARRSILVACMGIDEVVEVNASERPLLDSFKDRWRVPAGPSAIAVDASSREAWVWSAFDRKLVRIGLGPPDTSPPAPSASTLSARPSPSSASSSKSSAPSPPPETPPVVVVHEANKTIAIHGDTTTRDAEWFAGRVLFHTPLAFDGRACASCHPDARSDGLTWSSPNGPLQTPMLAGRLADTAPFGWLGEGPTVEVHLRETLKRLTARRQISEAEMHALALYATSANTFLTPQKKRSSPIEERGREIFESTETGCSQCHTDGGRKGDGSRHDVGTGGQFDTPSLRFIDATAPYLHDGRSKTLRELLVRTEGKMGTTKHLREPDVLALIAYLRSL